MARNSRPDSSAKDFETFVIPMSGCASVGFDDVRGDMFIGVFGGVLGGILKIQSKTRLRDGVNSVPEKPVQDNHDGNHDDEASRKCCEVAL